MNSLLAMGLVALATAPTAEPERLALARAQVEAEIKASFAAADVAYPPPEILLRFIKDEDVLELWAAPSTDAAMVRVKSFAVCARSGGPGPKRALGDGQVPEGFYRVDRFNPWSQFHLSLGVDYPNQSDRLRKSGTDPGGDIFIHGGCATIGCVPLQDGPMEVLYVVATDVRPRQRRIPVHLLPGRITEAWLEAAAKWATPELLAFWRELAPGYEAFERTRRPPRVRIDAKTGAYRIRAVEPVPSNAARAIAR